MGVGGVTVNGVDLTAKADRAEFEVEFQANRLNGTCKFSFKDESYFMGGSPVSVREQHEFLVTDGGVRIFGGRIAIVAPRIDGKTVYWEGSAVSFDTLLDERVIENGERTGSRYDDDDLDFIAGHHSELLTTSFVSRIRTDVLPDIDYSGMTLRKAIETLASYTTGAIYWVDENKQIHWQDPLSAQLVGTPGFDGGSSTGWALDGSAVVTADAGPGGTGDHALITTGNGSGRHETTRTVTNIVGNRRYLFTTWLWSSVAASATVRLDWQNSSSVSQRIDVVTNAGATSTWAVYKALYTAPASATKVIVMLGGVNNFTGTVRHDNLALMGEDAAWGVDTTPDLTKTFAPYNWREPRKATTPINRVLVIGNGISGWREHAASIAYYGGMKFEGVVEDQRVTTTDGIDSRAANIFRKYAFPARTGSYMQTQSGLSAGTWQIVKVDQLGTTSIEFIATLRVRWLGNGHMAYHVTYGEPEEDVAGGFLSAQSAFIESGVSPNVPDPVIPGTDTAAPSTPTGLALSTGYRTATDGTLLPYLLATWNANGDSDLNGYELAVDRALEGSPAFTTSASGTGGSLAAGTYRVRVTGVGSVQGETAAEPASAMQVVNAGQRLYVNITAKSGCASYHVYAERVDDPRRALSNVTTTGSNVEVTAEGSGATAPLTSTALAFLNPSTYRMAAISHLLEDVQGAVYYGARVRAVDHSGNYSGWTSVVTATVAADTSAPSIPTGLSAVAGFRLVGLTWERNAEVDLSYYEVRWTVASGGSPDTGGWMKRQSRSTTLVVTDLAPSVTHYFQVRAVDRSGNVRTSLAVETAVSADSNPEAGWSNTGGGSDPYLTAVPTLVGAADVSFNSVITSILTANVIDADDIRAGVLALGGSGNPVYLTVYNSSGQLIGTWDNTGLVIMDPGNTARRLRFVAGVMSFSNDGGATWTTALSADGIIADSIKTGTAPGGHNAIPNASFELSAWGAAITQTWTATTDWDDATSTVNLATGGASLALTTATY